MDRRQFLTVLAGSAFSSMMSPAEILAALPAEEREALLASLDVETRAYLATHWAFWARPDQLPPDSDWSMWLLLAGRGWGKTRVGAEAVRAAVYPPGSTPLTGKGVESIALVGETAADVRGVMVEGRARGILAISPKDFRPSYQPSNRTLEWPNGAKATTFNAVEPDQLRGPEHDFAWGDELAKWRYAQETFDQLQFGMRIGRRPRQVITTTPRPIAIIKKLIERSKMGPRIIVTRGRTLDNAANLSGDFLEDILEKYQGTRLGRQELDAEVLSDLPGALWSLDEIEAHRLIEHPALRRIVVAVDPAVSSREISDDPGTHGVIAAGLGEDGRGYVLTDQSLQGTPGEWARRVVQTYDDLNADTVVAEINQGGEMVKSTLRSVRPTLPVVLVRATRGKHVRAEPIAALYEQGRISHVGNFPELEDQLCLFTNSGFEGQDSPDRADALVWALNNLFSDIIYHTGPEPEPEPRRRRDYGAEDDDPAASWKVL